MKHQGLLNAALAEFAIHCSIFECRAHEESIDTNPQQHEACFTASVPARLFSTLNVSLRVKRMSLASLKRPFDCFAATSASGRVPSYRSPAIDDGPEIDR